VLAATHMVGRANQRRAEAQGALVAQQARASKLESLGTLAGGVAHDFNNILAAILGFGEMVQDAAPGGSAQARQMGKVMQAALRGKALVERILAFSRGGAHASVVFELAPVIEEVLSMLTGSLRTGIVLECALDAPGARVRGDPTQAFEAVMNLCTNAMQAMPQHGTLGVSLVRERVTAPKVLSHSRMRPGRYLALSISDDGVGITPQVMDRLFEPFFTTRRDESGTGLGLAVVHGVVAEFGGAIDVASSPGRGTRFTIYLPECEDTVEASTPALATPPMGHGQRILVVDDQATLVELVQDMLGALGYRTTGFTDPVAALAAFQADPAGFDAVITDEVMPAMTGTALTTELRRTSPDVPVLLVSGYGGVALATRAAAAGVDKVLSKPLQRVDLATTLARLLA
jgi:nitrogen-specific signal transduction histidine kinase